MFSPRNSHDKKKETEIIFYHKQCVHTIETECLKSNCSACNTLLLFAAVKKLSGNMNVRPSGLTTESVQPLVEKYNVFKITHFENIDSMFMFLGIQSNNILLLKAWPVKC